ncbi:MAG: hypothetical protein JKY37_28240 [Nannocystaceae bacterium]|nr:hypothetical protein [Nannocystaceae bacterium]
MSDTGFEVDRDSRAIHLTESVPPVTIRVPKMFGAFRSVERRTDYLVVTAEHGKASYHLTRARGSSAERIGFMAWASLRKTIRNLCLLPAAAKRVDMQMTYYRNGPGSSSSGAHGRVLLDRTIVVQGRDIAHHLGKSLEAYLHLSPEQRLASNIGMIQAFAVLDRQIDSTAIASATPTEPTSALWLAFVALRKELDCQIPG